MQGGKNEEATKELQAKLKKRDELETRIRARKVNLFESYNTSELKTSIQFKKHQGDPGIPTSILQICQRCDKIKGSASPCPLDTEGGDAEVVIDGGNGDNGGDTSRCLIEQKCNGFEK